MVAPSGNFSKIKIIGQFKLLHLLSYLFQDFSKFLDANFDAVEWVNAAFRAQKDAPDQKDVRAMLG